MPAGTDKQAIVALQHPLVQDQMQRTAAEAAEVLKVSAGVIGAPTADEVYGDLALAYRALVQHPDTEVTAGRVCLRRNPHDPTQFTVMLALRQVTIFPVAP
jgi:hypothetical protein